MQGSLYILVCGGTWLSTNDPDYEQKALSDILHNVCGSSLNTGCAEEIARIALRDNRLYPSEEVGSEFEELMSSMELPAAMKLFRPGNIPTRDGADPEYHTVLAETLAINSTTLYQNFFAWAFSTPGASAALEQAYENLIRLLKVQEDHYLPHFRKALAKNPFAPDYSFVTGLVAAGVKVDEQNWFHTFGYFQPEQEPYNVE